MNQLEGLEEKVGDLIFKEIGDNLKKVTALVKTLQDGYFERYSQDGVSSKVFNEFMHYKTITQIAIDCLFTIEEIIPDLCDEINGIIRASLNESGKDVMKETA